MEKKLFIESIEAIEKQNNYDISVSENLAKAFPDCFQASLLPRNHFLQNALIKVLQESMNDVNESSWIEHFCWELDFGKKNYRLKVTIGKKNIPMSNAGELWDFLQNKKNLKIMNDISNLNVVFIDEFGSLVEEKYSKYKVLLSGAYHRCAFNRFWRYEIKDISPKIPLSYILSDVI
ncbi:MAG: Riemerella phage, partial [Bacteroidota bacterium]